MFDKLVQVEERYEEVNRQLYDPVVTADMDNYRKLMQESKKTHSRCGEVSRIQGGIGHAERDRGLLNESGLEKDFREMVLEEHETAKAQLEKTLEELKILLLPTDPNDDRNVIVEIRGGAGGEEASLFANTLFRMYSMYAETKDGNPRCSVPTRGTRRI
jgi:peptide chain release factor 1